MIPRYNRPKIENIWTLENKFKIWTNIEILIAEKLSDIGVIPKIAAKEIRKKAKFNVNEINKLEKLTKHDVNAYIDNVSKYIGKQSKYFHHGVTSSDIIDTGFSIQLKQTGEIIRKELTTLLKNLKSKSLKYKKTIMIGRSHGIHAEPITFGLKLGSFYNEFKRNLKRLDLAIDEISICSISGPVGTYDSIDPKVEKYVAKKLKLKCEDVSTQVIPRDRHAFFFSVLGIIGSSIERLAVEIRHLQRTEILEVEERFNPKQKGSSAMPHKRNPILSENLTGLARYIRSAVMPAMENIVLWHERDISHSSVERIMAPDISIALDFSLNRLNEIITTMKVYPKNMSKNLNLLGGLHKSQKLLLKLTQKGILRQLAYSIIQKNAMEAWNNNKNFYDILKNDETLLKHISKQELKDIMKDDTKKNQIDWIFKNKIK
ncbi:MAG: adenylosuccinate lyase [Pelagibacteraceae bacterium]|jgi:adenylosuccinate lyase|nr:adenylosuccinate lyase [Pelagibacteraceae bacterium]MBT4645015.1 adenylosuccinate lyase [Pelagibacteraceae bacterium]MBT4950217.1 adenylosuccinate lyase [Pelagibacteraceae bacterium]MBT5214062.1 adenylosuccinate lyase [Pelagibacteraceae bacterium]MBT6198753.1 adenylosuccinate lyase [Pelagibacteraceae bacterium]